MALVGLDGRWLRVNQAICNIVGYPEAELLTKTFQDITHPDDLPADLDCTKRLLAGELPQYAMEKRYFHKGGHVVWILLSVALARDESGAPEVFVAQMQDITRRKETEFALEASLAESKRLLAEVQATQEKLRHLQEKLLTICPWTKRIFHDGRWMTIDEFLIGELSLKVSHGISDEALAGVMQEIAEVERQRK